MPSCKQLTVLAVVASAFCTPLTPASADVTSFLGGIVGAKGPASDFLGTWNAPPGGDIDHLVVSAGNSGVVRIQVFGRCEARVCNWGALPVRFLSDGPNSEGVVGLVAEFNLGFAMRRLSLHKQPGNRLRFDLVTQFTDGSDRHDYEIAGLLTGSAAPPLAATPIPNTPQASNSAPNPVVTMPAAIPLDNSTPVAASRGSGLDDCVAIDTAQSYIAGENGNWKLRDFLHVVLNFGPYKVAAAKGLSVLKYYRFDETCHIGRGTADLVLYRAAGEVPHQPMPGEDCTEIRSAKVEAVERDGDWKVVEGTRELYNYRSDRAGATQAATLVKSLNLTRQCYFDRKNMSASYWLSQ